MKNNLAEKIINKIQQEKISPTPKWEFVLKDSFFWGAFVLSILIGGISVAVILNTLLNNDWDLYMRLSDGMTKFVVLTLPYFWIIFLILFMLVAYLNIQKTQKAYKYHLSVILGGTLVASFLLGLTFYNIGLAGFFDEKVFKKIPAPYHQIMDPRVGIWQKPESGFLAGEILSVDENQMVLEDENGVIWEISLSDDILRLVPKNILRKGSRIKIVGEEFECEKNCFNADMLRPFEGMRRIMEDMEFFNKEIFDEMNQHMRGMMPRMMEGRMHRTIEY
ncbi:MAG: hypothetical protein V1851_02560 [Patescibacteria group bacterium]